MNPDALLSVITTSFADKFALAYKSCQSAKKTRLLPHMMSFYRRWYSSALLSDTLLTPAFLYESLHRAHQGGPHVTAVPSLTSTNRLSKITFTDRLYTLDGHPVVNDLRLFLDSCTPDFELTDRDLLTKDHEAQLLGMLSLCDPYYAEYLLHVSVTLSLVSKIPSIHSNRAQVQNSADVFCGLSDHEALTQIIDATARMAVFAINEIIPVNNAINNHYILSLLKKPVSTDDIFKYIYSSLGLNMDLIFEMHDEDIMDDMYASVLSSTFYMGVLMDKYFFTPFGLYLGLITPGYLLPCDMKKEMLFALEALDEAEDISVALFAPCSHYTLTPLGSDLFGVAGQATPGNVCPEGFPAEIFSTEGSPPEGFPIEEIVACLADNAHTDAKILDLIAPFSIADNVHHNSQKVYQIKIRPMNHKAFWKKFEMLEESTLHALYLEICYEFNFEINMNYSVFSDMSENPFLEYCSPFKKKRKKNTMLTTLSQLLLSKKHKFMLVLYDIVSPFSNANVPLPQKSVKFEIEIVKILDKNPNQIYPRVKSEARLFDDFETDWLF